MKKWIVILVTGFVLFSCSPKPKNPGSGVDYFAGSFKEAVTAATQQDKLIFVYCHTDWCGFCRKMEKSTLKEKEVNDMLNSKFINLTYDMEKGDGPSMASMFGVRSFPSYLILNADGSLKNMGVGYMPAENFLSFLKNQL